MLGVGMVTYLHIRSVMRSVLCSENCLTLKRTVMLKQETALEHLSVLDNAAGRGVQNTTAGRPERPDSRLPTIFLGWDVHLGVKYPLIPISEMPHLTAESPEGEGAKRVVELHDRAKRRHGTLVDAGALAVRTCTAVPRAQIADFWQLSVPTHAQHPQETEMQCHSNIKAIQACGGRQIGADLHDDHSC